MDRRAFDKVRYDLLSDSRGLLQDLGGIASQLPEKRERSLNRFMPRMSAFLRNLAQDMHDPHGDKDTHSGSRNLSLLSTKSEELLDGIHDLARTFDALVGSGDPDSRHGNTPKDNALKALVRSDKFPADLRTLVGVVAHFDPSEEAETQLKRVEVLEKTIQSLLADTGKAVEGILPASRKVFSYALDSIAATLQSKGQTRLASYLDAVSNTLAKAASSIEVSEPIPERPKGRILKLPPPVVDPMDAGRFSEDEGHREDHKPAAQSTGSSSKGGAPRQVLDGFTDQGFRPAPKERAKRRDLTNETDSREWRRDYQKEYRQEHI